MFQSTSESFSETSFITFVCKVCLISSVKSSKLWIISLRLKLNYLSQFLSSRKVFLLLYWSCILVKGENLQNLKRNTVVTDLFTYSKLSLICPFIMNIFYYYHSLSCIINVYIEDCKRIIIYTKVCFHLFLYNYCFFSLLFCCLIIFFNLYILLSNLSVLSVKSWTLTSTKNITKKNPLFFISLWVINWLIMVKMKLSVKFMVFNPEVKGSNPNSVFNLRILGLLNSKLKWIINPLD